MERIFFVKLLNEENKWNDELSAEYVEGLADMISKEEGRQAIQDLKVRKAAGPSVTAEMIKAAGEQAVDWLTSICNRIVKEEAIPESWQMSELVAIYKGKGDVLECSSSRGIKLLEHGMKVAERVLEQGFPISGSQMVQKLFLKKCCFHEKYVNRSCCPVFHEVNLFWKEKVGSL